MSSSDDDSTRKTLLIVEDDESIATGLSINLRLEGFRPRILINGHGVVETVMDQRPVLVLLDLSLPGRDGLDILRELRGRGDLTPIIVLSARQGEHDKVAALKLGADDYVTKPFALAELMARITAVLRRAGSSSEVTTGEVLRFGDLQIEIGTRTVTRAGEGVRLTHLEFELLLYFAHHPHQVLDRHRLLREVWGIRAGGSPRTVDNFVAQLRGKLEADPDHPQFLVTVRGSGYRFDPPP